MVNQSVARNGTLGLADINQGVVAGWGHWKVGFLKGVEPFFLGRRSEV
jgi:hypothetical protein